MTGSQGVKGSNPFSSTEERCGGTSGLAWGSAALEGRVVSGIDAYLTPADSWSSRIASLAFVSEGNAGRVSSKMLRPSSYR